MSLSKVNADAYKVAPYKIWIAHHDGTINGTLVVFKWKNERQRRAVFRKAKQQIEDYKGASIREVRFYDRNAPRDAPHVGGRDKDGRYYGEMEFMNYPF